jgi:DNA-binding transcriptional LysR family regulator
MRTVMDWNEQRLGRDLKLRDLSVLLTVARCGSMGKAAAELAVSQPAISKAIAEMEFTLGVRLLDRGPQGVEPTIYARALLDRGLIAFDELRQAVKHIEYLADPTAGELRIGCAVAIGTGFAAVLVEELSRRHPGIVFDLLAAESALTYRALEERKVDLVIARIFRPIPEEHMHAEVLYDEQDVVAAGAQNPWVRRRKVALADLMNEAWTLPPPDSLNGELIVEAFRARGLDLPRATLVTASVPVRNALLASGRFLSIVPGSVFRFPASKPGLKRLPIDLPTTRTPVAVITLKNRTLSPVAQVFIDCARKLVKPADQRAMT